ncbi:MFS transporter [Roseateles sp. BYS180W]|uniref:MFS transporter n=1 Tax=Roseateles rivi TaxID=3299028 RepID=A0ABW7FTZ7_9BURK
MLRLPNLLATPRGRLSAFFLLYVTEGIPLGFAITAVASQLRRMDVGPAAIGAFVASFYLPWAFKWAFGPVVDVFRSQRFGHRRAWIFAMQLLMAATLLALIWVPLPVGLALFTAVLLVHNTFAAVQDVAIDALAVNALRENETGLANGLMFAGAMLGQAIGGSGVLFLMPYTGFQGSFVLVALAILTVTWLVVWPMKEAVIAQLKPAAEQAAEIVGTGWRSVGAQMQQFAQEAFQSFLGSRGAFVGVFFSLLPAGAMALSLALQSNLAVELGMSNAEVAWLTLVSTLTSGLCMVVGGWISDRLGKRRTLTVYVLLMSLPVLAMAWALHQAGYVMPRDVGDVRQDALIEWLWWTTVAYNVGMGLMYGTRSAIMMDVTNPRVAGTQFTAYMAMSNLAIAFAATWQGQAAESLGYPMTLTMDAVLGLSSLLLLPWLYKSREALLCDARAAGRARTSALVLGALLGLALAPYLWVHDDANPWAGVINTVLTLCLVVAALFLYAATLLQQHSAALRRWCLCLALALLAVYLRKFVPESWSALADQLGALVCAVGGLTLTGLGVRAWTGLQTSQP